MGFVLFSVRIHRKYINLFRQNLNSLQVTKLLQSPAYKFIKTNKQKNTHTKRKQTKNAMQLFTLSMDQIDCAFPFTKILNLVLWKTFQLPQNMLQQ